MSIRPNLHELPEEIDGSVGDIFKLLSDLHIESKTLWVFSSDQWPSPMNFLSRKEKRAL